MALFDDRNREDKLKVLREREEEDLARILSKKYGVEYSDLSQVSIDTNALKLIPEKTAKENKMAAFSILNKNLNIAVLSPNNKGSKEIIEKLKKDGYVPKVFMVSRSPIIVDCLLRKLNTERPE